MALCWVSPSLLGRHRRCCFGVPPCTQPGLAQLESALAHAALAGVLRKRLTRLVAELYTQAAEDARKLLADHAFQGQVWKGGVGSSMVTGNHAHHGTTQLPYMNDNHRYSHTCAGGHMQRKVFLVSFLCWET